MDNTCKSDQQISAPANCSAGCTISASKGTVIIDDKGTASSDDDELSLQVTVTGVSPAGASWEALRETSGGYASLGTVTGDKTVTLTVLVRDILLNNPNGFTLRIQQTNYTDCYIELFVNMPNTGNLQVDKAVRGAAAPANWEFTLASSNCSLPSSLTNPISVSGSGGSNTFTGLTVYAADGSSCIYSITENDQDGYVLSTDQSDDLDNITLVPDQTTIVNVVNDEELYVLITDNSIVEGDSGTRSLEFVVELSNTNNPRNLFLRNQLRSCSTKTIDESFNDDINNWTAVNFGSGDCEWSVESNKLKEDRSSILRGCKGFLNYPLDAELYNADTNIYNVQVEIDSNYDNSVSNLGDNNDVGIVFGYKNQSNYYLARWKDYGNFYQWLSKHRYLQLIKVVDGESTILDEKEIDLPEAFTLKVDVNASGIQVLVNDQIELQSTTDQPVLHEFGVYSRDNDDAVFFDNVHAQTFCPPVPPEATSENDVEMEYEVVDGTASITEGDYLPVASGQATIPAGQNFITIPVDVVGDTRVEADETFVIRLTKVINGVPLDVEATGTIIDDDSVTVDNPTISISDNSTLEGDSGTKNLSFTVTLDEAAPDSGVSMNYTTSDGTATLANSDYQSASGSLTIPPGATTGTINVSIVGDTDVEADETFTVSLSSPVNGILGDSSATGTIINDDETEGEIINCVQIIGADQQIDSSSTLESCVTITEEDNPNANIADNSTLEGNSGTKLLNFTVTLDAAAPAGGVSMDYSTSNGTATLSNNDYQSASGTLTIPAGSTTGTISVNIVGDTTVEPNETFTVTLSNMTNAVLADSQAVGTIINDDVIVDGDVNNCAEITQVNQSELMPSNTEHCVGIPRNQPTTQISITDKSISEGDTGTATLNFTVSLNESAPAGGVSVDYITADDTASTGNNDYQAKSGTLTIPAGATSGTIVITINSDTNIESDETFTVILSNPVNALLSDSEATGTITNDDVDPSQPTPIAEYRFDECSWNGTNGEVIDSSTYANHGYADSGAQTDNDAAINLAASFDGANRVVVPHASHLSLGNNNADFSVSFWFKLKEDATGDWRSITQKGDASERTFAMWMHPSSNRIHYRISTTAMMNDGGDSSATIPLNTWTHLAYVKEGNTLHLYIDGALDSSATLSGDTVANDGHLRIGMNYNGGNPGTASNIDEFKIFDQALSATDVQSIVNNEEAGTHYDGTVRAPAICSSGPRPVAEYRFDECSWTDTFQEIKDSSGNGLHGTSRLGASSNGNGKLYRAGDFDGSNDVVIIDNDSLLQINEDMTISLWLNPDVVSGRQGVIFKHYNNEYELIFEPSGAMNFYHGDGSFEEIVAPAHNIPANTWTHVAIVRDHSAKRVKWFINGLSQGSDDYTKNPAISNNNVQIGKRSDSQAFNGQVDEIKFYAAALSDSEVATVYNNENAGLNHDGSTRTPPSCSAQSPLRSMPVNTVDTNEDGSLTWRSVWVNDGLSAAPYVEITAEVPEGTYFVPMPAGDFVSVDGIYCEARGASAGSGECFFETPSADYPQGRVVWRGTIVVEEDTSSNLRSSRSQLATMRTATAELEDLAENEIVLEFVTMPLGTQAIITGQAYADWYYQGEQDQTVDLRLFAGESHDDVTGDPELPEIRIDTNQYDVPEGFQPIPSLSEWGMIILSLLLMLVGLRQHAAVKKRYK
jgi:hypothetical protein